MERGRFQFAGWVVALVLVILFMYSSLQPRVDSPGAPQMSKFLKVLQNQTSKLTKSLTSVPSIARQSVVTYTATGLILIPGDDRLRDMTLLQLEDLYMRYVENIQEACGSMYHMGAEVDGGYHVCEKYLKKDSCLVYSFGSRRMFQFEDDTEKTYGCEIHTFDPFDGQNNHQHSKKVTFHKLGLSNKDQGSLLTLSSVKKKLKHTERTLDILKIDIEGAEWAALPQIMASGELDRVKLLIVEFHVCLGKCIDFRFRNKEHYLTRLAFLRNLYNAGFRLYYFRQWTMCALVDENKRKRTGCHEVHFMKV